MRAYALLLAIAAALEPSCAPSAARLPGTRAPAAQGFYDVVILDGRVMDPESGLDAVRNVGIRDGTIRIVTPAPIGGRTVLDARGLVVAPGFIDLHQHTHTREAQGAKVLDGVTAAFEMEKGVRDIDEWYALAEGGSLIHFGATVGHLAVRTLVLTGSAPLSGLPPGEGATRAATPEETVRSRQHVEHGLERGGLGVGAPLGYTPGATAWEVVELFRAAAAFAGAPVHVHVRGTDRPQHWLETGEVFLAALVSGAPLQILHANSSYGSDAPRLFEMIDAARARGLDVTTEAYPYTTGMTNIDAGGSEGWESWPDDAFADFTWPPTGERLTRESYGRYRAQGGLVVVQTSTEETLRPALASPLTMIVSDGEIQDGVSHPRMAGSFSRVLGHYVREEGLLTLMEALRKMTLMPAQRLEARAPAMRNKGRIRVGADADITIFDPATVLDRATYSEPLLPSAGIRYVLVDGVLVVNGGVLNPGVAPGRAIRAPIREPIR